MRGRKVTANSGNSRRRVVAPWRRRRPEGAPGTLRRRCFIYGRAEQADVPSTYAVTRAVDFLYDGARQRYLARTWNLNGTNNYLSWTPASATWTTYLGNEPYGDAAATVDENHVATLTEQTRYLVGRGVEGQQTLGAANTVRFRHGDLLCSTMPATGGTRGPIRTDADEPTSTAHNSGGVS
jgi:hypothetical protein